ncbi:MAG: alpha/beta hydrolase [Cytophagales bacterium]|nr:MAG: alpha/beta hydrolase [Cytophagales bacterium]
MQPPKTIVLIHGHGVDSSIWDELYPQLSADYQVIKPDFSTLTNHGTVEAYTEHVYSLLQSAQVEKAVFIGHSMGGYIALAFAERHPNAVSGLVLFHSTVFADDDERKAKRQAAMEQIEQEGSASFIGETIPKMVAETTKAQHPNLVESLQEIGSRIPPDALVTGIRAIAARPDRSHVVRDATFPVLIIAGKNDAIIPFDKSKEMATILNDKGTFEVLEGAGHLGMIEQPERSLEILQAFLVQL